MSEETFQKRKAPRALAEVYAPVLPAEKAPARTARQVIRDVIYALTLREFHSKSNKTRLGFIWMLFEPLVQMAWPIAIFSFVFGRHLAGYEYPVFLLHGLIPYHIFRAVCIQTMDGVNGAKGIMSYRPVHLVDVVIAKAFVTITIDIAIFTFIAAILVVLGYDALPRRPLEWAAIICGVLSFGLGLGMLFSAITTVFPESKTLIKMIFLPLYLASGVAFPISRFPQNLRSVLEMNPLLHWLEAARMAVNPHYQSLVDVSALTLIATSILPLTLGLSLFRMKQLNRVPI